MLAAGIGQNLVASDMDKTALCSVLLGTFEPVSIHLHSDVAIFADQGFHQLVELKKKKKNMAIAADLHVAVAEHVLALAAVAAVAATLALVSSMAEAMVAAILVHLFHKKAPYEYPLFALALFHTVSLDLAAAPVVTCI